MQIYLMINSVLFLLDPEPCKHVGACESFSGKLLAISVFIKRLIMQFEEFSWGHLHSNISPLKHRIAG